MPYALIIFDCDGTLVDSEYLNNLAIIDVLHACGLTHITMDHALEEFVGLRFSTIMSNITRDTGHVFPDDAAQTYLAKVRALSPTHMKAIEGAREVVLYAQSIADTCVVSNGERNNVLASLDFAGLRDLFDDDFIFTGLMAPNPKPAPDLFLLAAARKNIAPSETLVIEDSTTGVAAALAANMEVWGFCGTHHEPQRQAETLRKMGAHATYLTMHDMLKDLNKIKSA
tara:strand:- start:14951 stop:15631 length:681 start_codon:yes stop_codon:yes gene_type:complete